MLKFAKKMLYRINGSVLIISVIVAIISSVIAIRQYTEKNPDSPEPAQSDEILILVSPFSGTAGVELLLKRNADNLLKEAHLNNVRVGLLPDNESVKTHEGAVKTGEGYHATLIIWGYKVDDREIYPQITVVDHDRVCAAERFEDTFNRQFDEIVSSQKFADLQQYINGEMNSQYNYLSLVMIGIVASCQQNYVEAIRLYDEAFRVTVESDPRQDLLYFYRADAYYKSGKLPEALRDYDQLIKLYTLSPDKKEKSLLDFYINKGTILYTLTNYPDAIQAFEYILNYPVKTNLPESELSELKLRQETALFYRGLSYFALKRYSRAMTDYNKLIVSNRNFLPAYLARGDASSLSGNYDTAIENYNYVIQSNTPNIYLIAQAYNNRANTMIAINQYDDALNDANQSIDRLLSIAEHKCGISVPISEAECSALPYTIAEAYDTHGMANLGKGLFEEAIRDFQEALIHNPNLAHTHRNLGDTLFQLATVQNTGLSEALSHLNQAVVLDYNDPETFYLRARVYEALHEPLAAVQDYHRYLEIATAKSKYFDEVTERLKTLQ